MNDYQKVLRMIEEDHPYVVALRRHFHQYPEIGLEEVMTQQKIEEELDLLGISHTRSAGTGVVCEIKGEKEADSEIRNIALRADIDALPITEKGEVEYKSRIEGRMHACGHDGHTASLLGALRILHQNRDQFAGTIRFLFQPGEEIGYGARVMIAEGQLQGMDRTFGVHVAPDIHVGKIGLTAGSNNASSDYFKMTIHGKSAHLATPQKGADALYTGCQIISQAQSLVGRLTSALDPVVIGFGTMQAGTAYNALAHTAVLEGSVRTLTPELRKHVKSSLEKLMRDTCDVYGCSAEIEWKDFCSPVINAEGPTLEAQQVAKELFGAENLVTNRTPSMAGDDMADLMNEVTGCYGYVGCANGEKNPCTADALHTDKFDIDEDALTVAVKIYVMYALKYLNHEV